MDLEIKYEHGSMTIHLEEFLNCRSISKVRKLVKIIRSSYTPECEQQIKEFLQEWVEQYELRQKENSLYITGYEQKVKYCEQQLNKAVYVRDNMKRNSKQWKHYNETVKEFRKELAELKRLLSSRRSDHNKNIRNKDFYKKVLENIT